MNVNGWKFQIAPLVSLVERPLGLSPVGVVVLYWIVTEFNAYIFRYVGVGYLCSEEQYAHLPITKSLTQDLNTLIRTRYPMRLKPSWTDLYDNLWPIVCLRIGQRSHLNYLFVLKRTTTLSESLQKLRYKCTSNISPSMFGRKSITLLCSNLTGPSCNILNTTS